MGYELDGDIIYEVKRVISKEEVSKEDVKDKYDALVEEKTAIEEEIAPKEDRLDQIEKQLLHFDMFKPKTENKEEAQIPSEEEAQEVLDEQEE